jgi:hypothetical protein
MRAAESEARRLILSVSYATLSIAARSLLHYLKAAQKALSCCNPAASPGIVEHPEWSFMHGPQFSLLAFPSITFPSHLQQADDVAG